MMHHFRPKGGRGWEASRFIEIEDLSCSENFAPALPFPRKKLRKVRQLEVVRSAPHKLQQYS